MFPHSSANMGLTLSALGICFPTLVAWRLRQVRKTTYLAKIPVMDLTCDIAGTEAEILSQIRRYQKNAAVKSIAGSEQGEGDDFEVSPKDQLNYLTERHIR